MAESRRYWFPAKRYGWGWGLPVAWQGWCVLLLFVALVLAGVVFIRPALHPLAFSLYVIGLVGALVAVCFVKGEPPRWRWGDD